jgi:hypothetical protein
MTSTYDFKAWLETKNPATTYNFHDSCGNCLMGQYMASKGESWEFSRYIEYLDNVLGVANVSVLSAHPETFGGALDRVNKVLEIA